MSCENLSFLFSSSSIVSNAVRVADTGSVLLILLKIWVCSEIINVNVIKETCTMVFEMQNAMTRY